MIGQDGQAVFVWHGSVYVGVSPNRLAKWVKNSGTLNLTMLNITSCAVILRNRMSSNMRKMTMLKQNLQQIYNVVTNDTHYDDPDTVQNDHDVPHLPQNGIEPIESSLPGKEIDKLPKAKDKIKNTDFKVILNGRRLRS